MLLLSDAVTDVVYKGIKAYEPYFDEKEKVWKYSDTDDKMKDMFDSQAEIEGYDLRYGNPGLK